MSQPDEAPVSQGDEYGDEHGASSNRRDMHEQIQELNRKHEETMAAITNLSREPTRSYIYVPRERHIQPFSGDFNKDGRDVDKFIEEVERVIPARSQAAEDQLDFVLSLLKGAALEEVRMRMGNDPKHPCDIFEYLRAAFREKRSVSQLLQTSIAESK